MAKKQQSKVWELEERQGKYGSVLVLLLPYGHVLDTDAGRAELRKVTFSPPKYWKGTSIAEHQHVWSLCTTGWLNGRHSGGRDAILAKIEKILSSPGAIRPAKHEHEEEPAPDMPSSEAKGPTKEVKGKSSSISRPAGKKEEKPAAKNVAYFG